MHIEDKSGMRLSCEWVVKERVNGVWVARRRVKNVFTNYGLGALASALSGGYNAPIYLAIESYYTTPANNINPGDTSISLNARVDQTGDTQIILDVATGSQEIVTFTSVSGSGPYVYTLAGSAANSHTINVAPCCRLPLATDTVAQLSNEIQYDSTNFPNQRMQSPGGYSPGSGQWTVQFYYPGPTAQAFIALAGLTDNATIGSGNLHNHFPLGYNNNSTGNDLEIDGTITLLNG